MLGADNANIIKVETRDCEITYELFKCKRHVLIWNGTKTKLILQWKNSELAVVLVLNNSSWHWLL